MICDKCGWDDCGTGDAHHCVKRDQRKPTNIQMASWLASDEGKAAIANAAKQAQASIDALNKDREFSLDELNVPMTDFSRRNTIGRAQPAQSAIDAAVLAERNTLEKLCAAATQSYLAENFPEAAAACISLHAELLARTVAGQQDKKS